MLRFFRLIRRKLIDEDNMRKYIWYALGEIALVVIGILLALQINTWNEQKRSNSERIALTKSLIADLAQDTLMLNTAIIQFSEMARHDSAMTKRLNSSEATIDSVKQIAFYEFITNLGGLIEGFNDVTFSVLQSTGKLDLFDDSIQNRIVTHFGLQDLKSSEVNYQIYFDFLIQYSSKYPAGIPQELKNNYVNRTLVKLSDEQDFLQKFYSLLYAHTFTISQFVDEYSGIRDSSVELIKLLEESIE